LPLERAQIVLDVERLNNEQSDASDAGYYDWLYRRNPAGQAIIWYAQTSAPDAPSAGHYIVIPMRLAVSGEPVCASLSLNTLTHPRFRRQGIFTTLAEQVYAECARQGVRFTYGFPNPNSYPGFVGRLRFADIGRVPFLVSPIDARSLATSGRGRLQAIALGLAAPAATAAAHLRRWAHRTRTGDVSEVDNAWTGWDALWQRLRGKYPVMVVRDAAYMAWRFGTCPTRRYRLYVAHEGTEATGFVATRIATIRGIRAGLVVDFLVCPGSTGHSAGPALLAAALAEFSAARVALAASLMLPQAEEYGWLRRAGFFVCPRLLEPQPFPVILRMHGGEAAAHVPRTLDSWFLTMGDYDAV
jgi:GNAT superfamily N-acetyltransferase